MSSITYNGRTYEPWEVQELIDHLVDPRPGIRLVEVVTVGPCCGACANMVEDGSEPDDADPETVDNMEATLAAIRRDLSEHLAIEAGRAEQSGFRCCVCGDDYAEQPSWLQAVYEMPRG